MKTKIGGGELSPSLFKLPHKQYLAALSQNFKRALLPKLADVEIDAELTKLYVENGGHIAKPKAKKATARTTTNGGGDAEPTI